MNWTKEGGKVTDLLEPAGEEVGDRSVQGRFVRQRGVERDRSDASLVARDLGSAVRAQEFRDEVLRKAESAAVGAKIIVEFGSWHGCGLDLISPFREN